MARNYDKDELVGISTGLVQTIKTIIDEYDREDRDERDSRKSLWTKLERYFEGKQRIYYDMVAKDWRSVDPESDRTETNRHYDKVINNYRAHAESIIAALSVKPPSAIFYPNDADVEDDVNTARVATKIKAQIEKSNDAQMLMIKGLKILWNQGVIAAYVYKESSAKYGSYSIPTYGDAVAYHSVLFNCPECGGNIDEQVYIGEKGKVEGTNKTCAVCGYSGETNVEEFEEFVPEIIGSKIENKARPKIEVFSPLFVRMPFYARDQSQIPYLCLSFEQHYSALKNLYPNLKKRGFTSGIDQLTADERDIRVGTNSTNLSTVNCWWVRPWAYDVIDGKDVDIKELKKRYPDGMYTIIIDDEIVEIHNESLDDHWAISGNPLSTYIHGEPLGKPLAPIQDLQNEVVDLQIETFEHAIPETFARADVVDFKKYGESRSAPGMMFPANPPAEGQGLGDAFHSIKTATLSEEADLMMQRLDAKAQFVSAAFPSIYGGPAMSGSKTASEYTQSRAMALQRLSLTWNVIKYWWADVMSIAVPMYIRSLQESGTDENFVEKTNSGFVNVWIKQADLEGKIGSISVDTDENLPMTPAALKDVIVQLMGLKDERVADAMFHPNNIPLLTKALGAPDLYIPNSDDREKQVAEFSDLLAGVAVVINKYDNHEIEGEVCRSFLVSPTGTMLRKQNSDGIKMIEEHLEEHISMMGGPPNAEQKPNTPPTMEEPKQELPSNVTQFPGIPVGRQ